MISKGIDKWPFVAIRSIWDLYGHSALNRCNKLLEPAWGWRLLHNTYIYFGFA
jgi:hypothetical protein